MYNRFPMAGLLVDITQLLVLGIHDLVYRSLPEDSIRWHRVIGLQQFKSVGTQRGASRIVCSRSRRVVRRPDTACTSQAESGR